MEKNIESNDKNIHPGVVNYDWLLDIYAQEPKKRIEPSKLEEKTALNGETYKTVKNSHCAIALVMAGVLTVTTGLWHIFNRWVRNSTYENYSTMEEMKDDDYNFSIRNKIIDIVNFYGQKSREHELIEYVRLSTILHENKDIQNNQIHYYGDIEYDLGMPQRISEKYNLLKTLEKDSSDYKQTIDYLQQQEALINSYICKTGYEILIQDFKQALATFYSEKLGIKVSTVEVRYNELVAGKDVYVLCYDENGEICNNNQMFLRYIDPGILEHPIQYFDYLDIIEKKYYGPVDKYSEDRNDLVIRTLFDCSNTIIKSFEGNYLNGISHKLQ